DTGVTRLAGRELKLANPAAARRAGIAVIYQEFNLVPTLSARENIFLGQEPERGFLAHRRERSLAAALFDRLGVVVDPEVPCRELTVAQQQIVEIAKAIAFDCRILVMDEPSATLTRQEVQRLFEIIGDLKRHGIGIIYISHHLDEVFEIADRVTVLRDGVQVATRDVAAVSRDTLIEMMVGRKLESEFPPRNAAIGAKRLQVRGLGKGQRVRDIS